MVASSSKRSSTHEEIDRGKSLIYTVNSSGPTTDPFGTPMDILFDSESFHEMYTPCVLFIRYESNHRTAFWLNPYMAIFFSNTCSLWLPKLSTDLKTLYPQFL